MSKIIFMKYLPLVQPKLVPKLKMLGLYWNLAHLRFYDFDFNAKNIFYEIFTTCLTQISPKIKNAQNLFKFGRFGILKTSISILLSKTIFIKFLTPVRPKLEPELKLSRIYWKLANSTFQIYQFRLYFQKLFSWST